MLKHGYIKALLATCFSTEKEGWLDIPAQQKKRAAFTLAEVLVSLMVIGVIGAIVIPSLSNNRPKENKIMYRKAYGVISKAVTSMMETTYTTDKGIAEKSNEDFCKNFLKYLNVTSSNEANCAGTNTQTMDMFAQTTDGMKWYYHTYTAAPDDDNWYSYKIIVDVNGDRKPNCGVFNYNHINKEFKIADHTGPEDGAICGTGNYKGCENPDTFIFSINRQGKILIGKSYWRPYDSDVVNGCFLDYDVNIMSSPINLK